MESFWHMKSEGQIQWETYVEKRVRDCRKEYRKKKVCVMGVTEEAQIVIRTLVSMGIQVYAVLDNDPHQQKLMSYQVKSPNLLKKINGDDTYVIICRDFMGAKFLQAQVYGVSRENILYLGPALKRKSFIGRMRDLYYAWKVYTRWRENFKKTILLCPFPGTGDAYLTGRYLQNFIEEKVLSEDQYTIVVTSGSFKRVLRLFGYTADIQVVSLDECNAIKILIEHMGERSLNIYFMLYWGLFYQTTYRFTEHVSFTDVFENAVFGNKSHTISYLKFKDDSEKKKKIRQDYGYKRGRTVIVAPYANSFVDELDLNWWQRLIGELQRRGYDVYTNTDQDDKVIPGTKRIFLKYEIMPSILEDCGYFLGIRSGIFDLMHSAKCKKIIIYQDFMSWAKVNFFSLKNMFDEDDCYEYKLDNEAGGKAILMKKILSNFPITTTVKACRG